MAMYLARKIGRAKWDAARNLARGLADGEISADAVTADLRTREDKLSFWRCRTGEIDEIEDAALAIAAGADRLDKLDMVWLSDFELQDDGLALMDTEGETPVTDLVRRHVDICKLDHSRLGKVARHVIMAIEDERFCRITKNRVKQLLANTVENGRITPEELGEGLRAEIGR